MKRISALAFVLLEACSGSSLPTTSPQPAAPGISSATADNWPTYAHDEQRSSIAQSGTNITSLTLNRLAIKWEYTSPGGIVASPIVANNTVFVADRAGYVTALDPTTGAVRWQEYFQGGIDMTPAFQDGLLFVGTHDASTGSASSMFAALNPATGSVVWSHTMPGGVRSSPVFVGGFVYIGVTLGDPPTFCHPGGIYAFNEETGAPGPIWLTDPGTPDGGAVWSPLSYDGTRIIFGTGNTCNRWPNTADALVAMNPSEMPLWSFTTGVPFSDDDIGGGTLVSGSTGYVTGKDGTLYAVDLKNGNILWSDDLGAPDGLGGIGTPSLQNGVLIVNGGWINNPASVNPPGGILDGINPQGQILWSDHTSFPVTAYVARVNDVAIAGIDYAIAALNPATGQVIWSFPTVGAFDAGVAVVPSGLYAADLSGNVYAFSLAGSAQAAAKINSRYERRGAPSPEANHPQIPVYCQPRNSDMRKSFVASSPI